MSERIENLIRNQIMEIAASGEGTVLGLNIFCASTPEELEVKRIELQQRDIEPFVTEGVISWREPA